MLNSQNKYGSAFLDSMEIEDTIFMEENYKMPIDPKFNQNMVITVAINIAHKEVHHMSSHGLSLEALKNNPDAIVFTYELDRSKPIPPQSWYYNVIRNEVAQASNDYSLLEYCIAVVNSDNPKLKMKGGGYPLDVDKTKTAVFKEHLPF